MDTEKPLLLVHGYMDTTASSWWDELEENLTAHGYDHDDIYQAELSSGSVFSSLPGSNMIPGTTVDAPDSYADELAPQIEAIAERYEDEVTILAHSMGGLDARYYIEAMDGDDYVDTLVTVGTPHQGTAYGPLGYHTGGGRAMTPGSSFLTELNDDGPAEDTDYIAIWTDNDEVIQPPERSTLPFDEDNTTTYNIETSASLFSVVPHSLAHVKMLTDDDLIDTLFDDETTDS